MSKHKKHRPMFSLAPVEYRQSAIAGRGVFVRRPFEPGEVIIPYAPKQRRIEASDPEAVEASLTKLTLLSEGRFVIIPDQKVPGGWLCNHSCAPNAAIYSDRQGRIQCERPIARGQEVTLFYGWVTQNDPERDPCQCGAPTCRGFINFDLSDHDAEHVAADTPAGRAVRRRLDDYVEFLVEIGQEQVEVTVANTLAEMRAKRRGGS